MARRTMKTWLVALCGAALVAAGATGCNERKCGPGTVDLDNVCQPVNYTPHDGGVTCGPFTTQITTADGPVCIPTDDVCGPNTDRVVLQDDAGTDYFQCVGRGGTSLCEPEACPDSTPGGPICVSGCAKYFVDPSDPSQLMTSLIADANAAANATEIRILVYDPLGFAVNPNVPPLGISEVNPQTGAWKVEDVDVPSTNFIAVVVEDSANTGRDDYVFAGFPYAATPGQNLENVEAFGMLQTQDASWSETVGDAALVGAGCPASSTFVSCGAWIGIYGYREGGSLRFLEGVEPLNNALPIPFTNTFFMNPDHDTFTAPADQGSSATNRSGITFFVGASLGQYGGQCADLTPDSECETQSYTWDNTRLGGSAPGAVFIQLMNPEQRGE